MGSSITSTKPEATPPAEADPEDDAMKAAELARVQAATEAHRAATKMLESMTEESRDE